MYTDPPVGMIAVGDYDTPVNGGIGDPVTVTGTAPSDGSSFSFSGGWLGSLLSGLFGIGDTMLQNYYNEQAYERQLKDSKEAEQRANDEYDRRQKAAQEYNDSWAARLIDQGFNPLAALSKGQGVTATNHQAPSQASVPQYARSASYAQGISQLLAANNQVAQIKLIESQARKNNADASLVEQESNNYLRMFDKSIELITEQIRSEKARARIETTNAFLAESLQSENLDIVRNEAKLLYKQLEIAGVDLDMAKESFKILQQEVIVAQCNAELARIGVDTAKVSYEQIRAEWEAYEPYMDKYIKAKYKMLLEQIEAAEKSNNWYGFNQTVNAIGDFGRIAADIYSASKGRPVGSTQTIYGSDGGYERKETVYRY